MESNYLREFRQNFLGYVCSHESYSEAYLSGVTLNQGRGNTPSQELFRKNSRVSKYFLFSLKRSRT